MVANTHISGSLRRILSTTRSTESQKVLFFLVQNQWKNCMGPGAARPGPGRPGPPRDPCDSSIDFGQGKSILPAIRATHLVPLNRRKHCFSLSKSMEESHGARAGPGPARPGPGRPGPHAILPLIWTRKNNTFCDPGDSPGPSESQKVLFFLVQINGRIAWGPGRARAP